MPVKILIMYSDKIDDLFLSQLSEWELAKINYNQLENVKTRNLDLGDFKILIQFNPERMRSSAARVDSKSIGGRPCFLCSENRPTQQRGVAFKEKLTILVNPYPIFLRHLTITSNVHTDQRILPNFPTMLSLAKTLSDEVIFYNGPQCGASAPDHFHFQSGNKGFLPIEDDFEKGKQVKLLAMKHGIEVWTWTRYFRGIITLKGDNPEMLIETFNNFYNIISAVQPDRPEPMLNILAYFDPSGWIVHLIPRKIHRPTQFFRNGHDQILVSPASVDLGGVIILPREEDFLKINEDDIKDIFLQVCFNDDEIEGLSKSLV